MAIADLDADRGRDAFWATAAIPEMRLTGGGSILASGLMMFTAHATEMAANPAFRLKLILIAAALVNAATFHHWPFKVGGAMGHGRHDSRARRARRDVLARAVDGRDHLRPPPRVSVTEGGRAPQGTRRA